MEFDVYNKDGSAIDFNELCEEDWAKHLLKCDIDGFWIGGDGYMVLMDDCGNTAYPPRDRFRIIYHIDGFDFDEIY